MSCIFSKGIHRFGCRCKHGTEANSRDGSNQTPLHLASQAGHVGIVQLLVESGAIIDMRNNEGRTPVEEASAKGRHDLVQILSELESKKQKKKRKREKEKKKKKRKGEKELSGHGGEEVGA